jgi:hypothetical protein
MECVQHNQTTNPNDVGDVTRHNLVSSTPDQTRFHYCSSVYLLPDQDTLLATEEPLRPGGSLRDLRNTFAVALTICPGDFLQNRGFGDVREVEGYGDATVELSDLAIVLLVLRIHRCDERSTWHDWIVMGYQTMLVMVPSKPSHKSLVMLADFNERDSRENSYSHFSRQALR